MSEDKKTQANLALPPDILAKLRAGAQVDPKRLGSPGNIVSMICEKHLDEFIEGEIRQGYSTSRAEAILKSYAELSSDLSLGLPQQTTPRFFEIARHKNDPDHEIQLMSLEASWQWLTVLPPDNKKNAVFYKIYNFLKGRKEGEPSVESEAILTHLKSFQGKGELRGATLQNIYRTGRTYPQFICQDHAWFEGGGDAGEGGYYHRSPGSRKWHAHIVHEYYRHLYVKFWRAFEAQNDNYFASPQEIAEATWKNVPRPTGTCEDEWHMNLTDPEEVLKRLSEHSRPSGKLFEHKEGKFAMTFWKTATNRERPKGASPYPSLEEIDNAWEKKSEEWGELQERWTEDGELKIVMKDYMARNEAAHSRGKSESRN